jgi:ligand-binding SRPBCC domain-containing protein
MKTLRFTIDIAAPKEKVWENLWSDVGYRKWTATFIEGSYAESNWEQGSRILFLSPKGNGMYSVIEEKIPFEKMTFKHLGEIQDGVEKSRFEGEILERYKLSEKNGTTTLVVDADTTDDFEKYLNDAFPKALQILKQVSEES